MVKNSGRSRNGFFENKLLVFAAVMSASALVIVLFLSWYLLDRADNTISKLPNVEDISLTQNADKGNPDAESAVFEAQKTVSRVLSHMLLPNTNLSVVTITDADALRLRYPAYFQFAKNGDKIVSYPLGFIIYDPNVDKIVDVIRFFPVAEQDASDESSQTSSES